MRHRGSGMLSPSRPVTPPLERAIASSASFGAPVTISSRRPKRRGAAVLEVAHRAAGGVALGADLMSVAVLGEDVGSLDVEDLGQGEAALQPGEEGRAVLGGHDGAWRTGSSRRGVPGRGATATAPRHPPRPLGGRAVVAGRAEPPVPGRGSGAGRAGGGRFAHSGGWRAHAPWPAATRRQNRGGRGLRAPGPGLRRALVARRPRQDQSLLGDGVTRPRRPPRS